MLFMNEFDIEESVVRHQRHPVLSKATRFLAAYRNEVNNHSDGWPYWRAPVQAAAKLMMLIQNANDARYDSRKGNADPSEADLKAAISPIKAFYTKRGTAAGMCFPEGIL